MKVPVSPTDTGQPSSPTKVGNSLSFLRTLFIVKLDCSSDPESYAYQKLFPGLLKLIQPVRVVRVLRWIATVWPLLWVCKFPELLTWVVKFAHERGFDQLSGPVLAGVTHLLVFQVSTILEWLSRFHLEPSHDHDS